MTKRFWTYSTIAVASLMLAGAVTAQQAATAPSVDVMHFWTSGGEAAALNVVKEAVEAKGVKWEDEPIAGGGGGDAMTTMKARIAAGNPPAAMLMLGRDIIDWANEGLLADLQDVAKAGDWEGRLSAPVKEFVKVDGHWVSAPTNIHRVNMVFASKAAFDTIGAQIPTSWAEFNALAPKFIAAGITPLAHGGQPWQDLTLFDSVVLGIGGPDFYRKAFVELDEAALNSDTMLAAFDEMRLLRGMVDPNFAGRDWNIASAMVIQNKAAMQIMGDWAKGEFTNAGKTAGQDYLCFPSPGTKGDFVFLVNSFSMFTQTNAEALAGQTVLANAIMDPEVQRKFNILKGSIPAVQGGSTEGMDDCAKQNVADFDAAVAANTALPTFAYTHAAPAAVVAAVTDVVTRHFNSDESSADAVAELVAAVDAVR